eukprot:173774-Hanusia_phi.AAC.1
MIIAARAAAPDPGPGAPGNQGIRQIGPRGRPGPGSDGTVGRPGTKLSDRISVPSRSRRYGVLGAGRLRAVGGSDSES